MKGLTLNGIDLRYVGLIEEVLKFLELFDFVRLDTDKAPMEWCLTEAGERLIHALTHVEV